MDSAALDARYESNPSFPNSVVWCREDTTNSKRLKRWVRTTQNPLAHNAITQAAGSKSKFHLSSLEDHLAINKRILCQCNNEKGSNMDVPRNRTVFRFLSCRCIMHVNLWKSLRSVILLYPLMLFALPNWQKKKKTGEWRRIVQAKSCFSQVRALDPETLTYEEHAANPPISTSFDEFLLHYISAHGCRVFSSPSPTITPVLFLTMPPALSNSLLPPISSPGTNDNLVIWISIFLVFQLDSLYCADSGADLEAVSSSTEYYTSSTFRGRSGGSYF